MQVHQLVPALHNGDATGDSARLIRDYLRNRGFPSDIYAFTVDEEIGDQALPFPTAQPRLSSEDLVILHYALPSGMTDFMKRSECRRAMIYHNITPSYFWLPYNPKLLYLASEGRRHLQALAPFIDRAAADSEYNRQELEQLHYRNTCVLPVFVDQNRYQIKPSSFVTNTINDGFFNLLAVGRVAPNKMVEDVLRLYYFYKKLYSPLSRVIFVGKKDVTPAYYAGLKDLSARYGLLPEDVIFAGHVDWDELVAYYKNSHVLVSMSAHEGFCLPLIEAMICDTPVLAYASTAIPYTLGDAGIQFTEKDFTELAAICHRLKQDAEFREKVLESQRAQLKKYSKEAIERSIEEFLAPLISF